jgi:hypothetical protein
MNDQPLEQLEQWLPLQRQLYPTLPGEQSPVAIHPVSGTWQGTTDYLRSQFVWGGGASQEAFKQLPPQILENQSLAVLTFGPVQAFLGAGQRLRDWAVASWLCHYLSAVTIYHWEQLGGFVLLPLHRSSPLMEWIQRKPCKDPEAFWRAELPNVFTGIVPTGTPEETETWLGNLKKIVIQEWLRLVKTIEEVVVQRERDQPKAYLDGLGWRVIHRDHAHLWSVYFAHCPINAHQDNITDLSTQLHQTLEGKKLGRDWEGTWWGGRTSPSAGSLSIWHPGLKAVDQGGTWGISDDQLETWWERIIQHHTGWFGAEEKLNSIELIKRLASYPSYIEAALTQLWEQKPPKCPWDRFPDQTAVAAAWVPFIADLTPQTWNTQLGDPAEYFNRDGYKTWGIPKVDQNQNPGYVHPEILERRNLKSWNPGISDQDLETLENEWQELVSPSWTTPIQWTVGWRGDGDNMGKWLSGQQYQKQNLPWQSWHPTSDRIESYGLNVTAPTVPPRSRQIELPHMLDLSVLFGHWNALLYPLVEEKHASKVIFAGGDDFLLLGPLPEAVSLTSDLHHLWSGQPCPLTEPLDPLVEGWVQYKNSIYPVPGQRMTFSLGVVIAQRRIPQSLWHRNLNEAYKAAKKAGRDRVCVRVLFNSNQTLDWICPWPLWDLLMNLDPLAPPDTKKKTPDTQEKTALNRWEKLLGYMESVRLKQPNLRTVETALEILWQGVGLNLTWEQVRTPVNRDIEFRNHVLTDWNWWIEWVSLRGFLARQERDRQQWLKSFKPF